LDRARPLHAVPALAATVIGHANLWRIGPDGDNYIQLLNFGPLGVDPEKVQETARALLALGVEIPRKSE
jgi:hypothetical protein